MPTKIKLEAAHAAGDVAMLSRWAAKAIGIVEYMSHGYLIAGSCTHCRDDISDNTYCTRFATDPTGVAEFEKLRWPEGYFRRIGRDQFVTVDGPKKEYPEQSWVCSIIEFRGDSEPLNRCAAVLWARANAEEICRS